MASAKRLGGGSGSEYGAEGGRWSERQRVSLSLDTHPGPRGPENQPCSPPLKPRALDSSFAGPLTPTRGIKEDFQRVTSRLNCIRQGRLRGEAEL